MASTWSKATLLRRLEQAYAEQHDGRPLFDTDGDITDSTTTVAEMVTYLSRQIVVEAMTGRRSSDTPISPTSSQKDKPKKPQASG